jgi:hypothetical protein
MHSIRVACEGVSIGSLWLPPFQLRTGELMCFHLPSQSFPEQEFLQILASRRLVPGFHVSGRVTLARPAANVTRGLFGLFRQASVVDWLCQATHLGRSEALSIVMQLGLRPEWRVSHLACNPKTLLGLAAALAGSPDVIVFSTSGCDPTGIQAAFELVAAKLDRCAAIHLSYPVLVNGRVERRCFPRGRCFELQRRSELLVSEQ